MTTTRRRIRRLPAAATLALAPTLAACGADAPAELATVRDSAGITIVENAPGADERVPRWTVAAEPSLRIGVMEGGPADMFAHVWGARTLSDGRIVALDGGTKQVRLFTRDGRVLAVQGREGEGPGEYRRPRLWILPGDSILLHDRALARLTILHGDRLDVVRTARLYGSMFNPESVGLTERGRRLVIQDNKVVPGGGDRPLPQSMVVRTVPVAGGAADSILGGVHGRWVFDPGPGGLGVGPQLFDPMAYVVAGDNRVVHGSGDEHALVVTDPAGRTRRLIRWDGPDRTVREADVDAWIERFVARGDETTRPDRRGRMKAMPVADSVPAHGALHMDAAGRVWVARWTPVREDVGTEWWVFDPDGLLVATATLPRGRVLDIADDAILAATADELGVERVVKLTIRRGG